jgi:alpha-glucosidase
MPNKLPFLFVAFLCVAVPVVTLAQHSEHLGNYKQFQKTEHGVLITADKAKMLLTVYSPDIIRVRVVRGEFARDFSYAVVDSADGGFSNIGEDATGLTASTTALKISVTKNPLRLHFLTKDGKPINEDDAGLGIAWQGTEVTCYKKLFPDERFIGLGEKTGRLDRRGSSYVNWNTDHYAYSPKDDPLYTSTPFYIGLHDRLTYGIFFDNTYRTTFDFGASTDNRTSSFSAADGEMNYYFLGGQSVAKILEEYTYLTGRMSMPPYWSLGYQQCRWSYYPDAEVLNLARTFRQKRIPADVIYLDIHYMDEYKIFTWNPERFPHPKEMIDTLRSLGFHVVTIVDPGIKIENGYFAYDEGVKNDYFIKYPTGQPYIGSVWPGRCNFPDFTRPEVREWWGKSFTRLIEPGVEGFWNDMNEPAVWGQHVPDLVQAGYDGSETTMRQAHNVYGMQMARGTFEGTESLFHGARTFVLTRAAYSGIQRYAAVWTGDNAPSDDHMLLAVRLVNSMGLAGIAFAGPDIGGFSGDATPELFQRWLSIGVYTPFFRNHKENGMKRQEPWSFGEDVEEVSRAAINHRYEMLPYLYSTFYQSNQTGLPVARTLAIDYSFDEHVYWDQYQNEYLFGDNFLVAPVASTEKYLKVYLPGGEWYHYGSDKLYDGSTSVVVESPLNDLPVFVKAGGIIPLQSVIQCTQETPSDTLHLQVFYGKTGTSFVYYEDDGKSLDYKKGIYHKRIISFSPGQKQIVLHEAEGNFITKFKRIDLILHNFKSVGQVAVSGKKMSLNSDKSNEYVKHVVFENSIKEIVVKW